MGGISFEGDNHANSRTNQPFGGPRPLIWSPSGLSRAGHVAGCAINNRGTLLSDHRRPGLRVPEKIPWRVPRFGLEERGLDTGLTPAFRCPQASICFSLEKMKIGPVVIDSL